jgi:hypothetical protein
MRVTLHGLIPVYVQVDTEDGSISYVNANDEEFHYVSRRNDINQDAGAGIGSLVTAGGQDLPVAYDEVGRPFNDSDEIRKALEIAESADWPGWSFGW